MYLNNRKKMLWSAVLAALFLCLPASEVLAGTPVRVACYQNHPLISCGNPGEESGIFPDLLGYIAEQENWTLEYVEGTWEESLKRLTGGQIDMLAPVAHTPSRAASIDFGRETVLSNWGQVYVADHAETQSIMDLEGTVVAVLAGDVFYRQPNGLKELAEKFNIGIDFLELQSYPEVLEALSTGQADAALVNRIYGFRNEERFGIRRTPILVNPVAIRFAFPKGRNSQLRQTLDGHLAALKKDRQSAYYQALDRWLGPEGRFSLPAWVVYLPGGLCLAGLLVLAILMFTRFQVRRGLEEISRKNRLLENEIAERRFAEEQLAHQKSLFEAAFNSVPDAMVLCNRQREIIRCNRGMRSVFGYDPEELLGKKTLLLYASREEFERQGRIRFNSGPGENTQPYVVEYRRKDGTVFPGETLGSKIYGDNGEVLGFLGSMRDVTERQQAQQALAWELEVNRTLAELARLLLSSVAIEDVSAAILDKARELTQSRFGFVGYIDPRTGVLISPTMTREIWDQCQVLGKSFVFHAFKGLWGWVLDHGQSLLTNAPQQDPRSTGIPEGHAPIERFLAAPAIAAGQLVGQIALANSARDYTAKDQELVERLASFYALAVDSMRSGEKIRESEARFRSIFESAGAGMNTIDPEGRFLQANPAFCRCIGYTEAELLEMTVEEITHPDDLAITRTRFEEVRRLQRDSFDYEKRFLRKDGQVVWAQVTTAWVGDPAGQPQYAIGLVQDITKRKLAEDRLRQNEEYLKHLAHHDSLTQLPNRLLFHDRLQHAMSQARRSGKQLALLFFDLDRFKNINDSFGHEMGDRVLKTVARRLLGLVRASDTVARLGGDEFVVILEAIDDSAGAAGFAGKVLAALAQPIAIAGQELFITTSIGISLFPGDGEDAEGLMKSADVAMFRAKEKGRNTHQFYTPDMNARTRELLLLENHLRRALDHEQLKVYFQPQVDLGSGALVGMEALVRWQHPERGLVLPGDFIPIAEESGLIVPIGEWVLRKACEQGRRWQSAGAPPVRVAVNISARQFRQPGFIEMVDRVLGETGFDAQRLELEITETVLMENVQEIQGTLAELKSRGIQLAIDDFGTGYSSLGYLRKFPIRTLKIDRCFVRDVTRDANDAAIATSIIALARSMGISVIAEGVETQDQLRFLRENGCDQGQGHLFGKPQSAEDLHGAALPPAAVSFPVF